MRNAERGVRNEMKAESDWNGMLRSCGRMTNDEFARAKKAACASEIER